MPGNRKQLKEAEKLLGKKKSECVRVYVRCRPIFGKEIQEGRKSIVEVDTERQYVSIMNPATTEKKGFTFDGTMAPDITQEKVYVMAAEDIVEACLEGYNGTIFAYGQTGAGKSHTMEGPPKEEGQAGIIPRSFRHIFDFISANAGDGREFLVRASYLEIYNEKVRDLLCRNAKNSLKVKENVDTGVYVDKLTQTVVKNVEQMDAVQATGKKNRSVGATAMNQTSSRSHSIFTIVVEQSQLGADGEQHIKVGKLNLVDLAGSERQSKTAAKGDRLKEAISINQSLSALGNVITALVEKASHIPFRDSKLTRLLQDSLGGNTKTVMIANCGPADYNYDETISTLRYANRAKQIKNKPRINEDPKDAMLREFQDEIKKLREQLARAGKGGERRKKKKGSRRDGVKVKTQVEEKVVERVIEKVVDSGVTQEQLDEMEAKAREEKQRLKDEAESETKAAIRDKERAEKERQELEYKLQEEEQNDERSRKEAELHAARLQEMESKLIYGKQVAKKAAKQKAELRQASIELRERERQEREMKKEVDRQEEINMELEKKFSTLEEEVEQKTMKLKKLFARYNDGKKEIKEMKDEYSQHRDELWDMVRELRRQMKLKEYVLSNFVPHKDVEKYIVGKNLIWDENSSKWRLKKNDLHDGQLRNTLKPKVFVTNPNTDRRLITDFSKERQMFDSNPRYRYENVVCLDLDTHERTTKEYEEDNSQRVQEALDLALEGEEDEEIYETLDRGDEPIHSGGGLYDDFYH
eukprot:g6050.t1